MELERPRWNGLLMRMSGMMVLNAELYIHEEHPHVGVTVFQCHMHLYGNNILGGLV